MGTSAQDIRDLAVPPEDTALQDALADLERRIATYAAAVRSVEASLSPTPIAPAEQPEAVPAPEADSDKIRSRAAQRLAAARPQPVLPEEPLAEPAAEQEQEVPLEQAASLDVAGDAAAVEAAPQPDVAEPEGSEEALLASLDEATAKAVRVLRRLNPGKSVQELIRQAEQHKTSRESPGKAAGKSWFRFGR